MVGTTISHYKVLEKIDEGGVGDVCKVEDTYLGGPAKFGTPVEPKEGSGVFL